MAKSLDNKGKHEGKNTFKDVSNGEGILSLLPSVLLLNSGNNRLWKILKGISQQMISHLFIYRVLSQLRCLSVTPFREGGEFLLVPTNDN